MILVLPPPPPLHGPTPSPVVGSEMVRGPGQVSGWVGHAVTIPCRYDRTYAANVKYWCRGRLRHACRMLMRSDFAMPRDGRVAVTDNPTEGVFYVVMTALVAEDEGWYHCAISRYIYDSMDRVYLKVNKTLYVCGQSVTSRLLCVVCPTVVPPGRDSGFGWDGHLLEERLTQPAPRATPNPTANPEPQVTVFTKVLKKPTPSQ
ncbi:hypothetical protein JZ751_000832 [Albula glossodonta]|uniref:Immunoglobulin domain-containing protein n=1 Tax=Albula glossodonta TaxID=121402 RepID=A0A8T2PXI8_9TELE|nr:hypothetical protein JZ751_000832 [Albula glossodonta]